MQVGHSFMHPNFQSTGKAHWVNLVFAHSSTITLWSKKGSHQHHLLELL
uniref:Uncharacterized protein n=1 Tax=Setaria italica TaxID=4555 RepID=K3YFN7_SETIT